MARHKVPDLLRPVQDLPLPASPPPSRFWRHADVIDPAAEAYAAIYRGLSMALECVALNSPDKLTARGQLIRRDMVSR